MENILITGGAGFIGSNFVKYMLRETADVNIFNYDALTYAGNLENLKEIEDDNRYRFIKGKIQNQELVRYVIQEYGITGIINFAAESHVDRSIISATPFIETNIQGTLVLLEVAKDFEIKRFLQVSTDEVYGSLGKEGLFTEMSPLSPNSPYSASKTSADLLVRAFVETYGLNAVITRCSNNYGPYQFPEKLIPLMLLNAKENKQLPVYGDGMNIRDWIYVDDHCRGIWAAFQKGKKGEVYNIGGNCEKPNIEIVKTILSMLGKPESLITFVKDRLGHDRRYAIDSSKIKNELGWAPEIRFDEGMKKTVEWYLSNESWCQNVRSGAYLDYYKKQYNL